MSSLQKHVEESVQKNQPEGAALDIAIIIQIVTTLLQFIQNCPFGGARKAMKAGGTEATVAAYHAVKKAGYTGNAVDLARDLVERGKNAGDAEVDETLAMASSMPLLSKLMMIGLVVFALSANAMAGPFPETASGPFPSAQEGGDQTADPTDTDVTPDADVAAGDPVVAPPPPEEDIIPVTPPVSLTDANGYLTPTAIKNWINAHYNRSTPYNHATVNGSPWAHLQDGSGGNHTFTRSQVSGLSEWQARALHDAVHAGWITSRKIIKDPPQTVAVSAPGDAADGYEIHINGNEAYWFDSTGKRWNNQPGRAGSRMPTDGTTYSGEGRSFVVRDGRMYEASAAPSQPATTKRRTTVQAPVIQWGNSYCPNGNCRRYSYR